MKIGPEIFTLAKVKKMADFEIAYGETELFEGGYVNDPVDRDGETHRGVARRFHPDWEGWQIVGSARWGQTWFSFSQC